MAWREIPGGKLPPGKTSDDYWNALREGKPLELIPVEREPRSFRERVAALLRRMEFAVTTDNQWGDGVEYHCPCCGGRRFDDEQHRPDCELSAMLKEVER